MIDKGEIEPPSARLLALEARGLLDIAALVAAAPFLAMAPRGTPHAAVVYPGLGADDNSTTAIRTLLSSLGYQVEGWKLGRNIRPPGQDMPALLDQVRRLRDSTSRAVSLIGWSRGGILAREIAREIPDAVRLVVTLGSPFSNPTASNAGPLWRLLTGSEAPPSNAERLRQIARPIPVPATALYTRSDGVVAWQACLESPSAIAENIELNTTHVGLGFHPPALWVIADRLAQPWGTWRPFRPSAFLAPFFPRSEP